MKRKDFIKRSTLAAASVAFLPTSALLARNTDKQVRVALIGVGLRGQNHLELLLMRTDVEVVAICDIDDRMLSGSKKMIVKSGKKMPANLTGDP